MTDPTDPTPGADLTDPTVPTVAAGTLDDGVPNPSPGKLPPARLAQIAIVVVAVIVVGLVLAFKGGGGDDDAKADTTTTTEAGSDGSPATSGGTGSPSNSWPATATGRPAGLGTRGQAAPDITVEAEPGVYLWNDYDGWHLWAVGGGDLAEVTGTLTSNDTVAKAVLAVPGAGTVELADKVVRFTLPADGEISGIDFNPGFYAKQLVITLDGPDGPIDSSLVHTGSKAADAPYPLVVSKN